jgi:hypothetical protein
MGTQEETSRLSRADARNMSQIRASVSGAEIEAGAVQAVYITDI